MRITKQQLKRIIQEEKQKISSFQEATRINEVMHVFMQEFISTLYEESMKRTITEKDISELLLEVTFVSPEGEKFEFPDPTASKNPFSQMSSSDKKRHARGVASLNSQFKDKPKGWALNVRKTIKNFISNLAAKQDEIDYYDADKSGTIDGMPSKEVAQLWRDFLNSIATLVPIDPKVSKFAGSTQLKNQKFKLGSQSGDQKQGGESVEAAADDVLDLTKQQALGKVLSQYLEFIPRVDGIRGKAFENTAKWVDSLITQIKDTQAAKKFPGVEEKEINAILSGLERVKELAAQQGRVG